MRTIGKYSCFSVILACACGAEPSTDEASTQSSQELYYDANTVWTDPSISVCWKFTEGDDTERAWVREAVEKAIEPLANVDFTGWGFCTSAGAEVTIQLSSSQWPRALVVGSRAASPDVSMYLNPFKGGPADLNGDSIADFADCWKGNPASANPYTGVTGASWPSVRQNCIQAIAVHEFAHVLAIAHEQNRPDTPSSLCTAANDGYGNTQYGYWDITSISNYCNPAWNGDGMLSPLDVSGLVALYGKRTNDHVWYSVGNVRDYGNVATDRLMFDIRKQDVSGTYTPQISDFNGDGAADVLWYRPGTLSDPLWWGKSDRTFQSATASAIDSTYQMTTGDFDNDGRGDVFMHAPGAVYDRVWYGRADKTFDNVLTRNIAGTFKPLAGDFDGDGFDDIFLYAAGSPMDAIWWGRGDRTFTEANAQDNVTGTYVPLVGDFDGDTRSDIFWYLPGGSGNENVWWGRANRTFDTTSTISNVSGTYDPAVGDFDGNGASDIIWSSSAVQDPVFLFSKTTRGSYVSSKTSSALGSKPFVGDFDDDGLDDVFWYVAN